MSYLQRDENGRFLKGHLKSNTGRTHFKKSHDTWNKGLIYESPKTKAENHYNWKEDKVTYRALHQWIEGQKIKPDSCQNCGKNNIKLELSNISGKYQRDINDFEWVCRSCNNIRNLSRKSIFRKINGKDVLIREGN